MTGSQARSRVVCEVKRGLPDLPQASPQPSATVQQGRMMV